jgi:hypothetical protein
MHLKLIQQTTPNTFHYIFFKLRWQQETAKMQIRKPMTRSELEQKENKQIHLLLFYKQRNKERVDHLMK